MELLEIVLNEFTGYFGEDAETVVSAPGRLDFLNTHQDYKGLPVVGVGVNLRIFVAARRRADNIVRVASGNLKDESLEFSDSFSLDRLRLVGGRWFGDYFRAALIVLMLRGFSVEGLDVWVRSGVPIGGGLGSSGSMLVAFIGVINEIFGLGMSRRDIAEAAYEAEHDVMSVPCGRLDQYSSAYGGLVIIETRPPYSAEKLDFNGLFLVLDSGIRHSTASIHPVRQGEINEALKALLGANIPSDVKRLLGSNYWEPRWEELKIDILEPYLKSIPNVLARRIIYTIKAHESTVEALKLIRGERVNVEGVANALNINTEHLKDYVSKYSDERMALIGYIMTYQHKLLSNLYEVSLPVLDRIVDLSVDMGAYGAKLSGAGLGGAVIALIPSEDVGEAIAMRAMSENLIKRWWIVKVDEGLRVEKRCHGA
ncbi:MAG: galactokinase family protein [Thermoprotei archaeon]|nr:galactokinase family protein [Thermoprotei archaeon]